MRRSLFAALIGLALLPAAAAAQETGLVSLESSDAGKKWQAVGRLDFGGRGFCTATLISPQLILTAAHCLFDADTSARIPVEDFEFLLGLRNGRAAAYRAVSIAVPHPDFVYAGSSNFDRVGVDVALLQLQMPIQLPSVVPFATAPRPARDQAVGVVSYAKDRAEAPSLQQVCKVLEKESAISVLSCAVDHGASGAPVFDVSGPLPKIVSVISAKAELDEEPVALAVSVEEVLPLLLEQIAVQQGGSPAVSGVTALSGGQAGTAKFLQAP